MYSVDPNVAKYIDHAGKIFVLSQPAINEASGAWPPLAIITTALAAIFGTWAKVKPDLTTATAKAVKYEIGTKSVIDLVEQWKSLDRESWDKFKAEITKKLPPEAIAVIETLRNGGTV